MITTDKYTLEYDTAAGAYRLNSQQAPYCPVCGYLMSGYDNRRRKAIDGSGAVYWLILRRLYCPRCKALHIELPNTLVPYKQYEAAVMDRAEDPAGSCPADNATMRRWKK